MDDVESQKTVVTEEKEGLWARLKSKVRRNDSKGSQIGTVSDIHRQSQADSKRVEEVRDLLSKEESPRAQWANKEVTIDSINLQELPIDWDALTNLGRVINEIKDDSFEAKDLADIKPHSDVYPVLPMIASVIANKRNPEIPVVLPTHAEVKAMKPWLAKVGKIISRFSQKSASKFERYVEKRGQQVVVDAGFRMSDIAEQIATIENPRHQFLTELTTIYNQLASPEFETEESFFGDHEEEVSVEEKIHKLLLSLRHVRDGGDHKLYTKNHYPLLTTMLPIVKFPPDSLDEDEASIAGAELMEGIQTFLKQQGVRDVMAVPRAKEVNLFDPGSWGRGLTETFASQKLERVKRGLPNVLTQVHKVLPQSGPQLSEKMYDVAENICILKAQGTSTDEIAQHIFVK
jgi:hypothetical protein